MPDDTMIDLPELTRVAPSVATPIRQRFQDAGIGLLGTIRRDGSPRVSPIEVTFVDDRLFMGMMPSSRKRADVSREPRVCLLTPVSDRSDVDGEGKLFGRLDQVDDATATRVFQVNAAENDMDAEVFAGSPVFELKVAAAAWQRVDDEAWTTLSWSPGAGVRHRRST